MEVFVQGNAAAAVTPQRIFQMAWGYAPPLVLEAAIRHRVFDVLEDGPRTIEETAAATGASQRGLKPIMNLLVGLELLSKADGHYALTPESAAFLVSTKPGFQGGMIRHTSKQLIPAWLQLNEAVGTGKPATAVNQEDAGGEFFQQFVADLFPMGYAAAQSLAAHLAPGASGSPMRVLDLAAGSGVWSIALAQGAPDVTVTVVDWPQVLPVAKSMAARFGLAGRYTFVPGDLSSADFGHGHHIATLGHILHSEGPERSRALLRKTFDAMASGGTIVIAEFLVNADRTAPVSALIFAVNMLVMTDNGDTYSFEEISEWLRDAGFVDPRLLDVPGPSPLILATKPLAQAP
jgi:ubiquinone/menaquinone biosynthesis C-methylase UbiE